MRTFVPMALAVALASAGISVNLLASRSEPSSVKGTAYKTDLQPLSGANVQIRDIKTATPVLATRSGQSGDYAFPDVEPGSYIVELWDSQGRVVGTSAPFTVAPGVALNVSVVQVATGTVTSTSSAGFSLLGLGPTTSLAVLGAAGASAVTAVVATRPNASPSR